MRTAVALPAAATADPSPHESRGVEVSARVAHLLRGEIQALGCSAIGVMDVRYLKRMSQRGMRIAPMVREGMVGRWIFAREQHVLWQGEMLRRQSAGCG